MQGYFRDDAKIMIKFNKLEGATAYINKGRNFEEVIADPE
jgi:hypothetical protein